MFTATNTPGCFYTPCREPARQLHRQLCATYLCASVLRRLMSAAHPSGYLTPACESQQTTGGTGVHLAHRSALSDAPNASMATPQRRCMLLHDIHPGTLSAALPCPTLATTLLLRQWWVLTKLSSAAYANRLYTGSCWGCCGAEGGTWSCEEGAASGPAAAEGEGGGARTHCPTSCSSTA
jgi:hypothetical protein